MARELLFSRRVYDWVRSLRSDAPETLLVAARAHTVERWRIPRNRFPKDRAGYHQWRKTLADFHADRADEVLRGLGYPDEFRNRVRELISRTNFPADADAQTLEDADCLVFLETKLHKYLDEWGDPKTIQILRKTLLKMTVEAKKIALELPLPARSSDLLRRAVQPDQFSNNET